MSITVEFYDKFKPIYYEDKKYLGSIKQVIKDVELNTKLNKEQYEYNNYNEFKNDLKNNNKNIKNYLRNNKYYVKITFHDGTYEGQIDEKGNVEGIGKDVVINEEGEKDTYIGEWKENRYDKGVYTWPDGSKYEGDFENNNIDGEGTFYYNNGAISIGIWVKNYLRLGEIKCKDCNIEVVELLDNSRSASDYIINNVNVGLKIQPNGNFIDGERRITWRQKNGHYVEYTAYWKDNKVDTTKDSTLVVIDNTTGKELYYYKNYYPIIKRKDISTDKPLILVPKFYKNKDIVWPSCASLDCCQENFASNESEINISNSALNTLNNMSTNTEVHQSNYLEPDTQPDSLDSIRPIIEQINDL